MYIFLHDNPGAKQSEAPAAKPVVEDDCKDIFVLLIFRNYVYCIMPSMSLSFVFLVSHLSQSERKKAQRKQRKALAKAKAEQEKEKGRRRQPAN